MAEFLLEHWQLVASVGLALVNLIITLSVHRLSTSRIKTSGSFAVGSPDVTDSLTAIMESLSALMEAFNEQKKNK